jgi:hypothetical protein
VEYLEKRYEEIRQLCEIFKARAYIHVQKQNHFDVSLEMMIELAQRIRNGVHKQQGLFDSVVGQIKTQEKRWIVDVDTKDETKIENIIKILNRVHPQDVGEKIETIIPTKNGYHLITKKFNVMEFQYVVSVLGIVPDIQKKNPTLLYLPNSLT